MSLPAEIAVIGSCLVDQRSVEKTLAALTVEHFTDPNLGRLFKEIKHLQKEGIGIDHLTVWEWLAPAERDKIGMPFLVDITEQVPTALHVEHYIDLIRQDYFIKRLVDVYKKGQENPIDPKLLKEIQKLWTENESTKGRLKNLDDDLMIGYIAILEKRMRGEAEKFLTGYSGYDGMTSGHNRGQLITIGARTSRGKTTFLLCLANRLLVSGHRVLFYSAEMGYEELVDRLMSARTKIPLIDIRGKISREDLKKVMNAASDIHKRPLAVNDGGKLTIEAVRAGIESFKPDIVMVDYIQRFIPPNGDNRAAFFSNVANELKALARDKNVLIFASSQLSRSMEEHGKERAPNLSDLKESGGIEEASDVVVLLHSKKVDDNGPTRGFDFIFAKQRNGPLGKVRFVFLKSTVAFEEMEDELPG